MKNQLDRREFLKLAGLVPVSLAAGRFLANPGIGAIHTQSSPEPKNVLVVVFDAWSAYNISLYGYARQTTPNLARLAERAVVYHNHFAGGNFTTPGTASLLTGALPWSHRAFRYNSTVAESFATQNFFSAFQNHYRIAYSHNPLVNTLFDQFHEHIDEYVPQSRLFLLNDGPIQTLFKHDQDIATVSWARAIKRSEFGYSYSLYLAHLYERLRERKIKRYKPEYPRGLPNVTGDNYFLLDQAVDWLGDRLLAAPSPFMAYFHFLPPHFPYKTHRDFAGALKGDGFEPVYKPWDIFHENKSPDNLLKARTDYDEFILYADREFERFFKHLEESGLLENTWVVLTGDHGELFERGIMGHSTPMMIQPINRIPLMVFEPGRRERLDIYTPTSAADVLPTLLHVTGQAPAGWTEGSVLPPFAPSEPDPDRSLYAVEAKKNDQFAPFVLASFMMVKWPYKLAYYFGYKELDGGERVDLYDIQADPEEMNNLYPAQPAVSAAMFDELKARLAEKNEPYR